MTSLTQNVTGLLVAWSNGDPQAFDALMPLIYQELNRIAKHHMGRERAGHTLQTKALVNEAYIRLIDQQHVHWQNRAHFLAIAAKMMRRVLVDYARSRQVAKRGGGAIQVSLDNVVVAVSGRTSQLVALDDALSSLALFDRRKAQVVELRYFAGLSVEETAEVLKVSPNTVMRDWSTAQAWLHRELNKNIS